jgi:hypothetical protein
MSLKKIQEGKKDKRKTQNRRGIVRSCCNIRICKGARPGHTTQKENAKSTKNIYRCCEMSELNGFSRKRWSAGLLLIDPAHPLIAAARRTVARPDLQGSKFFDQRVKIY